MEKEEAVFNSYKPLKNILQHTQLEECLIVIWAYSQHLQFNIPIPNDIEVHREFLKAKIPEIIMSSWNLFQLAKHALWHAQTDGISKYSFRKWNHLAKALNGIRAVSGIVGREYVTTSNVKDEMFRIAHQQFPWQEKANHITVARYMKIFSHEGIEKILIAKTGLSIVKLYFLGYIFLGTFMKSPILKIPIDVSRFNLTDEEIQGFLKLFSIDLVSIKAEIKEHQKFNEKFEYSYNPLMATPMIKISHQREDCVICPIPRLMFNQFTTGLYYSLCKYKKEGFDNAFGEAFQNYTGDVIKEVNSDKTWVIIDDANDRLASTVDWIIQDKQLNLFIECKTKRITMKSKSSLEYSDELQNDIEAMSDALVQMYKAQVRYEANQYPSLPYEKNKKAVNLLVTLEESYINILETRPEFKQIFNDTLTAEGIEQELIDRIPYVICSIRDLEIFLQVGKRVGINKIITMKLSNEDHATWGLDTFIKQQFKEEYEKVSPLFQEYVDKVRDFANNSTKL